MKKTVILVIATLLVVTSLISGVFAAYKTQIDDVSSGEVTAKNFVLTANETLSFEDGVKIAPGEKLEVRFKIANYEGNKAGSATSISETSIRVEIIIEFNSEIKPLILKGNTATVENKSNVVTLNSKKNQLKDTITFDAGMAQSATIALTIEWPHTDNDIDYINKTALYKVTVIGTQVQ